MIKKIVEFVNALLRIIITMIKTKYIVVSWDMGLVESRKIYHQAPDVHFSYSNKQRE